MQATNKDVSNKDQCKNDASHADGLTWEVSLYITKQIISGGYAPTSRLCEIVDYKYGNYGKKKL